MILPRIWISVLTAVVGNNVANSCTCVQGLHSMVAPYTVSWWLSWRMRSHHVWVTDAWKKLTDMIFYKRTILNKCLIWVKIKKFYQVYIVHLIPTFCFITLCMEWVMVNSNDLLAWSHTYHLYHRYAIKFWYTRFWILEMFTAINGQSGLMLFLCRHLWLLVTVHRCRASRHTSLGNTCLFPATFSDRQQATLVWLILLHISTSTAACT